MSTKEKRTTKPRTTKKASTKTTRKRPTTQGKKPKKKEQERKYVQVLTLLREGCSQTEIAVEMEKDKSWVSRTVQKLKKMMLIKENGDLTDKGLEYVAEAERDGKNEEEID